MSIKRKLTKIYTPEAHRGFLGPDHTARAIIQVDFSESDPFILLMDDVLDKKDQEPVGGPHPHAGFETVSLLLEGELGDDDHKIKGGDFQIMTAGSGIIHTETISKKAKMRLLQLWLNLPKKDRWATPRIQDLALANVPKITQEGLEINLYSGSLQGISSPIQNHVPVIIADVRLQPQISTTLHIPSSYTTFLYTIEGNVAIGDDSEVLNQNQVGWLDRFSEASPSELKLTSGKSGARVVLYSGPPQGDQIVSHGPFIGDTQEDIKRLYQEFRQGKMHHISTVAESQKIKW